MTPRPFLFDMETGDPDDVLTLLLLAGHPQVDLKAVTVTPGTHHQVGVVRHVLSLVDHAHVPVGAFNLDHKKARGTKDERYVTCVSGWHYKAFGDIEPSRNARPGWEVLDETMNQGTTLVTGAPLKNVGRLLLELSKRDLMSRHALTLEGEPHDLDTCLGRIVAQGGFAGEGVVPLERQLPKFAGKRAVPTYNFNGDVTGAQRMLGSEWFSDRRLVGKNVCHGVTYDDEIRSYLQTMRPLPPALALMRDLCPPGKKLHDPLAACCAIHPHIGQWAEVEMFREKGAWGSRLCEGSGTHILVDYDRQLFMQTLAGSPSI